MILTEFLYHKIRAWRPLIYKISTFNPIGVWLKVLFPGAVPFFGICLVFFQGDEAILVLVQSLEKLPGCLLTLAGRGILTPPLGHKFLEAQASILIFVQISEGFQAPHLPKGAVMPIGITVQGQSRRHGYKYEN
jgi:hypothetical protein